MYVVAVAFIATPLFTGVFSGRFMFSEEFSEGRQARAGQLSWWIYGALWTVFVLVLMTSFGFFTLMHLLNYDGLLDRNDFGFAFAFQHVLSGLCLDVIEVYQLRISGVAYDPNNFAQATLVFAMHLVGNFGLGALLVTYTRLYTYQRERSSSSKPVGSRPNA
jgi:hypothetical protein